MKKYYAMHNGDYEYVKVCESPADWKNSPRIGYTFDSAKERDDFIEKQNQHAREYYSV